MVIVVSQRLYYVLDNFFLMSFGIEVIVIDFLSPFVRLMYMIELLILIFFLLF